MITTTSKVIGLVVTSTSTKDMELVVITTNTNLMELVVAASTKIIYHQYQGYGGSGDGYKYQRTWSWW